MKINIIGRAGTAATAPCCSTLVAGTTHSFQPGTLAMSKTLFPATASTVGPVHFKDHGFAQARVRRPTHAVTWALAASGIPPTAAVIPHVRGPQHRRTNVNPIPLVDLAAQRDEVAAEVAAGWAEVLDRTAFVSGPQVGAFEVEYAAFAGVGHCVGVANGTDAIELALRALGVGSGDECVLPANTFIATAEAVVRTGATPVLVDQADDDTYLLDAEAVAAAVGPRTRAILPVHLYGQAAPVERLLPIAERVGAVVVEDAAQSQGARRNGRRAGALGHAAGTSFYPGKNLGAYGDAGAVLTDSADVADAVRLLSAHGSPRKYEHPVLGFNSRLDTLQAVVLSAKLRRLGDWNAARRAAADRYSALPSEVAGVRTPRTLLGNEHVWHLYVVRVPDRDRVVKELQAAGIGAAVHYPTPVHLTGAFSHLGYGHGAFPVAERCAGELLSLPLYAEITADQQDKVASALAEALS
jgi:dTDP-4-amino-4,6-dideoxygalactose transaminase